MLHAKDLMTGDIILYEYQDKMFPARILEIYHKSLLVEEYSHEYEPIEIDQNKIFPITLTPEILEKNGFKRSDNGENKCISREYAWGNLGIRNFTVVSITFYEGLRSGVKVLTKIEADCSHDSGINQVHSCDIEFVHQIQHALRLCGITKEIII